MKSAVFTFIFLLNSLFIQAQKPEKKGYVSFDLFALYPYYFTPFSTEFNYGFGGNVSLNTNVLKFSIGLYHSTKKYHESFEANSNIDHIQYQLNYLNIPVLIGFPIAKQKLENNRYFLNTGIIINMPNSYKSFTYYKNNTPFSYNNSPYAYHPGISIRLGLQYLHKLNNLINLSINPFCDYKFKSDELDFNNNIPHWHPNSAYDKFLIGLSIGIECRYSKL